MDSARGEAAMLITRVSEIARPARAAAFARKYSVALGKCCAGAVRFVFEDCLQCGCQAIWLCKQWHAETLYSKAFMLASIGTGLFLSFAVPVKEFIDMQKLKQQSGKSGAELVATDSHREGPTGLNQLSQFPDLEKAKIREYPVNMTVAKFLHGGKEHGRPSHYFLVLSALAFWCYMAAYGKLFDDQISSFQRSPPIMGFQIFVMLFLIDILIQIWVLIHTWSGHHMLVSDLSRFACGVIFTFLGRFDTYGDVVFTYKLLKCPEITRFTIRGNEFILPFGFPLHYFAMFAMVIGVGVLQAAPGMIMLCRKWRLPMAMKFNEFNLILNVMAHEAEA